MKDKFNRYCAEVMGWVSCSVGASFGKDLDNQKRFTGEAWSTPPTDDKSGCIKYFKDEYNPYDDLNQASEVFDKLNSRGFDKNMQEFNMNVFVKALPIKESINKFITSTMGEK